jgi:hypothetical protein
MLDVVKTLLSQYRWGVDAALCWDAVDYLQPGHEAIMRWGLLGGPQRDCAKRRRYYAPLQVLKYLQPGGRVLDRRYLAILTNLATWPPRLREASQ